jgi:hypothetical protein
MRRGRPPGPKRWRPPRGRPKQWQLAIRARRWEPVLSPREWVEQEFRRWRQRNPVVDLACQSADVRRAFMAWMSTLDVAGLWLYSTAFVVVLRRVGSNFDPYAIERMVDVFLADLLSDDQSEAALTASLADLLSELYSDPSETTTH